MKTVIIICVLISQFSDLTKSYKIKEENNTINDIIIQQLNKPDNTRHIEEINSENITGDNQNSTEASDFKKQLNEDKLIANKQVADVTKEKDKIQQIKKTRGRYGIPIKGQRNRLRYGGDSRLMVRMSSIAVDDCSTGKNRADDGTCVSIEISVDSNEIEEIIINSNTTEITDIVINTKEIT